MKSKRIITVLVALAILISSLALGFSSFAKTNNNIALNTLYRDTISGADDKIWYTFTPQESGKYALVSYSQKQEAYLFTKTRNPDGSKVYNQIAYAGPSDPDYLNHFYTFTSGSTTVTHYETTFYLECYLVKGVTYYFAAGVELETVASREVRVVLYNISYDDSDETIESISVDCPVSLKAYTDGQWEKTSTGENYYYYNYSKLIQNITIKVKYKDGTVVEVAGNEESYDGKDIAYSHKQNVNHWYAQGTDEYTQNTLTIKLGVFTCDIDVQIENTALYGVRGKVVDYATGNPIKNASVTLNEYEVAKTDNDGEFAFVYAMGYYKLTVKTPTSIDYSIQFVVDSQNTANNNHTDNPIRLINTDYVKDGIINAKDYAFAKKNGYAFYPSITNYTSENY